MRRAARSTRGARLAARGAGPARVACGLCDALLTFARAAQAAGTARVIRGALLTFARATRAGRVIHGAWLAAHGALVAFALAALGSCALFFPGPLSVAEWTPEDAVVSDPAAETIWVKFSRDVDQTTAEAAFSLRVDGEILDGEFTWDTARAFSFAPFHALGDGLVHEIRVSTECEDLFGNSLAEDFSHEFRVSDDSTRPSVASVTPANAAVSDDPSLAITLEFSEAMDDVSVLDSFSLSPAAPLAWSWNAAGDTATITPMFDLTWGEEYSITVGADAADLAGNTLGDDFISTFTLGSDTVAPTIVALRPYDDVPIVPTPADFLASTPGSITVNAGVEASWHLELEFSEPVDRDTLASRLSFSPTLGFDIDGYGPSTTAVIRFTDRPIHGTEYHLLLADGYKDVQENEGTGAQWYFTVDGPLTTPPRVNRVYMREGPAPVVTSLLVYDWNGGAPIVSALDLSGYGVAGVGFFAFYITVADPGSQDPYALWHSFEENFRLGENNDVGTFSFEGGEPAAVGGVAGEPEPAANEILIRMYYTMTETAGGAGSLDLELSSAFTDSLANPLADDWAIRLY